MSMASQYGSPSSISGALDKSHSQQHMQEMETTILKLNYKLRRNYISKLEAPALEDCKALPWQLIP